MSCSKDGSNENTDRKLDFVVNAGGTPSIMEGTLSTRPQPGIPGRLFLSVNSGRWYRDTGAHWAALSGGPRGKQGPPGPVGPSTPILTGIGTPLCTIGNLGDIYIDLSNGCQYFKMDQPVPPSPRSIPAFTGNTLLVGTGQTYTTIQAALAAAMDGDRLLLDAELFAVTDTITINKSVTIEGQGPNLTQVIANSIATSPYYLFNVTVSNVVFLNMRILEDYPRSAGETDTVIAITNKNATGIYIDHCEIGISEIGIGTSAAEIQVSNCLFFYAPDALPNNRYNCILISNTTGDSVIYNNTFSPGSQDVGCFFTRITNVGAAGGTLQGKLLLSNNTQVASAFTLRHLLAIEEYIGDKFKLYISGNSTVDEGNVPVLLESPDLNIFSFIQFNGNLVQNTAGKGMAAIDTSYTGSTDIFSVGNTIVNQAFDTGWASATAPASYLVGYRTTITPPPQLPIVTCYWLPIGGCLS